LQAQAGKGAGGVSKQEPSAKAIAKAAEYVTVEGMGDHTELMVGKYEIRTGKEYAIKGYADLVQMIVATAIDEAVAAERARIVTALRENIARHKEAFDLHQVSHPLIANEHNAVRWGLKKAIAIVRDKAEQ
jgi:hypothetical protein